MNEGPPEYNSQTIIDAANAKLQEEGINTAQTVFQSALLDWVDDVTMGDMRDNIGRVKEEIANLWLAYAAFNRRSNLNKSATEVYEQAINCPVAGDVGKIWAEYTQFLEARGRPKTAQKIYLHALVGDEGGEGEESKNEPRVKDSEAQAMLWNGFLCMMQSLRKNPDLTLDHLKSAVDKEHRPGTGSQDQNQSGVTAVPDQHVSSMICDPSTMDPEDARPSKRSRWDQVQTEKLSASSIDTVTGVLLATSNIMPPDVETLWHARDGGSLPTRPEPPLFTASPPKLGDPSGKDLIGNEAALKILEMLTAKTHDGKSLGSALLELCHACWMMTALKEEGLTRAQTSFEKKIITEREAMEVDLDARISVAGGALAAVRQANEKERNLFNAQSEAQCEQLLSSGAWEFRKLLYAQQIMLTSSKLPGFEGPTVDSTVLLFQSNVCSVLHSAFYLRTKVGKTSHVNMLNKQLESLKKYVPAVPASLDKTSFEQPKYQAPLQAQQLPMQFQQTTMPQFSQQPMMYTQQQPMIGVTPMGYQAMPQMIPQQGQHAMQQQQLLGFQHGQPNKLS